MKRSPCGAWPAMRLALAGMLLALALIPGAPGQLAVGAQTSRSASLTMHLSECPAGYMVGDTIFDDCHGNGIDGHPIELTSEDGSTTYVVTAALEQPGPGVARFDDLPAGDYAVSVVVPVNGSVYTSCTDANQGVVSTSFHSLSQTLSVPLAAGAAVICDWYQIPAADGPAPPSDASLELHTALCHPGTDPDADLSPICHDLGLGGVDIGLNDWSIDYSDTPTTGIPNDPGPGVVSWSGLGEGSYSIELSAFDPAVTVIPFCTQIDAGIPAEFSFSFPSNMQSSIGLSLYVPAETKVVCDLYFMPSDPDGASLQLSAYYCPNSFEPTTSTAISTFQQQCVPSTASSSWYILYREGQSGIVRTPGDDPAGAATFDGLADGDYWLMTSIPGHDNDPWGFCSAAGGPLVFYVEGPSRSDPLRVEREQGAYTCEWFDVAENSRG